MYGILGRKLKMTQVFDSDGARTAATLIKAGPCVVLKSYAKGNAHKLKLGFEDVKQVSNKVRLNKPELGYFRKLKITPKKFIKEVNFSSDKLPAVGEQVTAQIFKKGDFVDICGTSIGKGFQGGMKRWHWAGGPKSHGSTSRRRVGSIGASAYPSRVLKGKHMPGRMGGKRVTVQNLKVIDIVPEDNLLVLKGAVVGHKNSLVVIQKSKKKQNRTKENEGK